MSRLLSSEGLVLPKSSTPDSSSKRFRTSPKCERILQLTYGAGSFGDSGSEEALIARLSVLPYRLNGSRVTEAR
jgi:hypothetical protein